MTDEEKRATGLDGRFFRLVATFEAAAMQQLGKIAHPVTGEVEVNLEGARDSIDMLAMMAEKTEGNLNEDERRLLEHILYQLRLNFVDVADAVEAAAGGEGGGEGTAQGSAPEGDGPEDDSVPKGDPSGSHEGEDTPGARRAGGGDQ